MLTGREGFNIQSIQIMHGYDYDNGFAVDKDTGEAIETLTATIPVGSIIYTPADQKSYKKRKQKEQHQYYQRKANALLGAFYFANKNDVFNGLSPATVARLFYLCSFARYDCNQLMRNKSTPIYRKDLPELLHLSPAAVKQFVDDVSPKYIQITADKTIL